VKGTDRQIAPLFRSTAKEASSTALIRRRSVSKPIVMERASTAQFDIASVALCFQPCLARFFSRLFGSDPARFASDPFQKHLSELPFRQPADSLACEDSSSSELHNLGRESRCVSNRLHPPNQRSFRVGSEKLGGRFRGHWATNQRKRARITVDNQRKWAASVQRSWAYL
jgi:hypothetical protein